MFNRVKIFSKSPFFIFNILVPFIFVGFTSTLMQFQRVFQFDPDEGQEMVKAILYSHGFKLYTDIWSDQPPLFTVILSHWLQWVGASVFGARLLVLGLATLLIWSFTQILRLTVGNRAAIIGAGLLMVSANFSRLSVSVMIGLPSLSLAVFAIYLQLLYCQQTRPFLLILSGISLGLSLHLKMLTIFLVPLLAFYLIQPLLNNWRKIGSQFRPRSFYPLLVWLTTVVLTFKLMEMALGVDRVDNFLQFHLQADLKTVFKRENSWLDLGVMLLQDLDIFLLAIFGFIKVYKTPDWLVKFPAFWLLIALPLLVSHKPLWYHHYLVVSIPLVWLAVVEIEAILNRVKPEKITVNFFKKVGNTSAILIMLVALAIPIKLGVIQWQNQQFIEETKSERAILEAIVNYKSGTHWLFTDIPMYGVYAGVNIPPEIAVLSRKRVASGAITAPFIEKLLQKYHPEQFILGRFPEVQSLLQPQLDQFYEKISQNETTGHYVKKSLKIDVGM